jgi:pimeloyl-ACP methyl ester carboxylesterase
MDQASKLKALFTYDKTVRLENSPLEIRPYRFIQQMGDDEIKRIQQDIPATEFWAASDHQIVENANFAYTIFVPRGITTMNKAILLLHGLNERNWDKYLPWAEQLALTTGRAVVLFPMAFHMNRTPDSWYNPRMVLSYVSRRKEKIVDLDNSTFVNIALSSRLSESPLRFYISGRESIFNLWQLISEIKQGKHPLFKEDSSINIFAYSIGAFLAQVLLLANPDQLTSDSKLFMFCGGSLFSRMNGNARDIMDREAFRTLREFLLNDFICNKQHSVEKDDFMLNAFKSMLSFTKYRDYREAFYEKAKNRIKAISLKKDCVIPTIGIKEAIGKVLCPYLLEEMDFPYEYTHQNPFPVHARIAPEMVRQSFSNVFERAARFLE